MESEGAPPGRDSQFREVLAIALHKSLQSMSTKKLGAFAENAAQRETLAEIHRDFLHNLESIVQERTDAILEATQLYQKLRELDVLSEQTRVLRDDRKTSTLSSETPEAAARVARVRAKEAYKKKLEDYVELLASRNEENRAMLSAALRDVTQASDREFAFASSDILRKITEAAEQSVQV